MKGRLLYGTLLIVVLAGLLQPPARAQTSLQAATLFTSAEDAGDHLQLRQVFTILDNNQPIPKEAIQFEGEGQIYGSSFEPMPAKIQEATMPLRIALVIDASGSMAEEIKDVRQAAVSFARKAPNNAEIAVFRFAQDVVSVQGFTGKNQIALIENAILSIQNNPPGTGNTCFYNATLEAIKAANSGDQGSRPAVVIFTDGIDSESGSCGEIKENEVVNQARQQNGRITTQVHTIGLCVTEGCGNVNTDALRALAEKTFASTKTGTLNELDQLFDTILTSLNSQWVATADIKPKQGTQKGTIDFKGRINGLPTSMTLTPEFDSPKDYTAGPPRITIARSQPDAKNKEYAVTLSVTNPETVKEIILVVRAEDSTIPLQQKTIKDIRSTMLLSHSFDGLSEGGRFCQDVRAVSTDGKEIKNGDNPILFSGCQAHTLARPKPTFKFAEKPSFDRDEQAFIIKLSEVQQADGVKLSYDGSINQGNQSIMAFQGILPQDGMIDVDLKDAKDPQAVIEATEAKDYTLHLTLENPASGEQFHAPPEVFTVEGRKQLSFWQRVGLALGTPIVLSSILVIVVLVAGVLVTTALVRSNRRNHTPQPKDIHGPPTEFGHRSSPREPLVASRMSSGATEIDDGEPEIRIRFVETPDPERNHERVIKSFPCVIGRENSALLIHGDAKISRQHVQISLHDSKIMIEDLGSSNGTAFVVQDSGGMYTVKKAIPKRGSAEWDNQSLIRIGTKTVIELIPQGALRGNASRRSIGGLDNRTEIAR